MRKIVTETIVSDADTGEIIRKSINRGSQNGDDWVIIYREALANLGRTAPLVAWKVFAALGSKQNFERGLKVTKKAIAEEFGMSYDNVIRGFNWLKENGYLKEHKVDGVREFLLNPDVTTCGRHKKAKLDLWNSVG